MLDYNNILTFSWNTVLEKIERKELSLESEEDLRCHLFHQCLISFMLMGLKLPLPIHAEKDNLDLVLGEDDVVVELKFSKKGAGGYTTQRESILGDLDKLKQRKAKSPYFGIISEVDYFFNPESENFVDFKSLGFSGQVVKKGSHYCLLAKLSV